MVMSETEYVTFSLPRGISRSAVRQLLVDHAEREHWTLDRVRIFPDGRRVITLRRKIIRVMRTA